MAQRTVVPRALIFPVPENVNDETAAALPNPGVSAWLSLAYRAKLIRGENVLILGATGVTGKLAVKIAKRRLPQGDREAWTRVCSAGAETLTSPATSCYT